MINIAVLMKLLKVTLCAGIGYIAWIVTTCFYYHFKKGVDKVIKNLLKYLFLLCLGGLIYYNIEILWRGYSHFSMFIVGGLCFVLMGLVNEIYTWDFYLEWQVLIGLGSTLILEFVSGCVVNLWLGWNVWDYSDMPLNILGQICLPFAILWIPLVVIGILLDDFVRWKFMKEEKPRYNSFIWNWISSKIKKKS